VAENIEMQLFEAQDYKEKCSDQKHKRITFEVRDRVLLRATKLKTERPRRKLDVKMLRPSKVMKVPRLQADASSGFDATRWMSRNISNDYFWAI